MDIGHIDLTFQVDVRTDPARCQVTGEGLATATTRRLSSFRIEAFDILGEKKRQGGDHFIVAIRGRGNLVRARVIDEHNGNYLVEFKPTVSGRYQIDIRLQSIPLPGSPFNCIVSTPTPSSPQCILRGAALLHATARKEEYFEIQFRDALGQIAHAEDLDVYVDEVDEAEREEIRLAKAAEEAEAARLKGEEEAAAKQTKKDKEKENARKKEEVTRTAAGESADTPASPFHVPKPSSRPQGADGFGPLLNTSHECVVTSAKPLVLRESHEKNSPRLGQLMPGQRLRLLELHVGDEEDGQKSVRASVAVVNEASSRRRDLPCHSDWRNLFTVRPAWLDGVPTPRKQPLPFGPREPSSSATIDRGDHGVTPIGWVTVHKGSQELVTPRGQLQATERQRHMQQWARRIAVDKSIAVTSVTKVVKQRSDEMKIAQKYPGATSNPARRKKGDTETALVRQSDSVYTQELASDPKGIGFAFGGVEPGRLHARGQLFETHKVHYSIAMCGIYKLHVGLRHEGIELPGSPFLLEVTAGPASALSTRLPPETLGKKGGVGPALSGVVGSDGGCEFILQASDKMGNRCTEGGANVSCQAGGRDKDKIAETAVRDNQNGTYLVAIKSKFSGMFDIFVSVDGLDVLGSPAPMRLLSDNPDLTRTELKPGSLPNKGSQGLKRAVAGKPSSFTICFKDQYGNAADPGSSMTFEMALIPQIEETGKTSKAEKATLAERWKTAPPHPCEFIADKDFDEEIEVRYTAQVAGNLELHLWVVRTANRRLPPAQAREALPDSPFLVHCEAGKAHASGSLVEGFTRLDISTDRKGQPPVNQQKPGWAVTPKRDPNRDKICPYERSNDVYAGEPISVRPRIRDRFLNYTAAPEGALSVMLEHPDGQTVELPPTVTLRSGLTNYDVRYEPMLKGKYQMHVSLKGTPVAGSPVRFECIPNFPDVSKSRYILPTDSPALLANKDYVIKVITCDRCGNQLDHGGATVQGRLQSANLPPQQNSMLDVEDKEDGTYLLKINLQAASELKVIITIDKERQGDGGGEFPPIPMTFANLDAINKKLAKQAKQDAMKEQAAIEGRPWSLGVHENVDDTFIEHEVPGSPEHSGNDTPISGQDSMENPLSAMGAGARRGSNAGVERLRQAGEAIVAGFGGSDGRRQKVAAMAIVADAAKDAAVSKDAKRSIGSASQSFGTSATSSFGSLGSDGSETTRERGAAHPLNRGELKSRGEQLLKRRSANLK